MLRIPAWLVLVQNNGVFGAATGPVEPHVGLACRGPARLL